MFSLDVGKCYGLRQTQRVTRHRYGYHGQPVYDNVFTKYTRRLTGERLKRES
ncbi:hypothetical protein DPMN_121731 [Dreissena polymorpha]|uniref:Uncharacterized protein n=1 Tax=Dreissena polymorpha TaxID=45954 RepID=A0A9D4GNC3_DREPO|nr:hypothetical protein DPMN_121731 [Dreissena polymorpha]